MIYIVLSMLLDKCELLLTLLSLLFISLLWSGLWNLHPPTKVVESLIQRLEVFFKNIFKGKFLMWFQPYPKD